MKRKRAVKEFDYYGVAALGDYQYDDAVDKWDEIKEAFKNTEEIFLKRSHGDVRNVGTVKYWDLDKTNKKVFIGFNKEDLDDDIEFDKINQVSIEYETLGDKIIKVNHICIGNTFIQKCPKKVCSILKRQRGDEPDTEDDPVTEPDGKEKVVPEEPKGSEDKVEEISNKILLEEMKLLKEQVESMSKAKEEPEPDPEGEEDKEETDEGTKVKLGVPDKIKHSLPTTKNEVKVGFTKWKFI